MKHKSLYDFITFYKFSVTVVLLKNILNKLNNKGFNENMCCPHCKSDNIIKNGKYKRKQRFICKDCDKNFNSLTNTPISMSHMADKWPLFIECLIKGLSLRASEAEIGVTYVTLFYWRHKLMRALKSTENNSFAGAAEADDTFLAYSEKGSRKISGREPKKSGNKYCLGEDNKVLLLVAVDHRDHLLLKASASKNSYVSLIYESLGGVVSSNEVFCSNYNTFYKHFANLKGIKQHFRVSPYNRTEEKNIDLAYRSRRAVETWLYRFRGIASKYLNNYLSLYNCLRKSNLDKTEIGITNFMKALRYVNIKESYASIRALNLAH
ncbi:MAG: IS1595 family transposase [Clostridiaceae bacterium]|nr:IS1595 family transposase [Clostridiaceae bacterium]